MNKIIKKLQVPGYETKVTIVPRKNTSAKVEKVPDGIQLSLDIEMESTKQGQEK
ncbi:MULTISPECIES: hypothetical protein [Bacillaceae]|uniref:hypothetical protein n=1 Tax=Shouchella oshimensis TaxID=290588 RepID=UPI000B1175E6|nr:MULTISPECIES: hypothetical protein [Bacillaceae]